MKNSNSLLNKNEQTHLEGMLRQNTDIFAWTYSDMLGINPSVAAHKLNILHNVQLVWQKVRRIHLDCQKVIQMEVDKLLAVGFIWEVTYLDWLANVVVVPKKWGA